VGDQVPNDAAAIVGGRHGLRVGFVDLDFVDSATVFLKGGLHNLGLSSDFPDADLALLTSGDDSLAVVGWHQGGDTVVVGVINCVEQFAGAGQERTDLAIRPA